MSFKFEKLQIWQLSMDYAEEIFKISGEFPKNEIYNLTSQIRRAVDSIALNIAEDDTIYLSYEDDDTRELLVITYNETTQEFKALSQELSQYEVWGDPQVILGSDDIPIVGFREDLDNNTRPKFIIKRYNTKDDIDRLVKALRELFAQDTSQPHSVLSTQPNYIPELEAINGWQGRYRQIMQWASKVASQPEIRLDQNRVEGCEASAWLVNNASTTLDFKFDSDSRVVKGLGLVILSLVNGREKQHYCEEHIRTTLNELGFNKHLSASRASGVNALLEAITDHIEID